MDNRVWRIGREKREEASRVQSECSKFLKIWMLTVSHQEQVPGYLSQDHPHVDNLGTRLFFSNYISAEINYSAAKFYDPCFTFCINSILKNFWLPGVILSIIVSTSIIWVPLCYRKISLSLHFNAACPPKPHRESEILLKIFRPFLMLYKNHNYSRRPRGIFFDHDFRYSW